MTARDEYPLADEGWLCPEYHDCEMRVDGVLCMVQATGAIYSGWTDYVWLCAPHLDGEVAKGWERVDFSDDEDEDG
jgi:hypothetical protein